MVAKERFALSVSTLQRRACYLLHHLAIKYLWGGFVMELCHSNPLQRLVSRALTQLIITARLDGLPQCKQGESPEIGAVDRLCSCTVLPLRFSGAAVY